MFFAQSVMFFSYVFQSTLVNFTIYTKITRLHLNVPRKKKTYLATINITCYKMKDPANLHLGSSQLYTTKLTKSPTTAI